MVTLKLPYRGFGGAIENATRGYIDLGLDLAHQITRCTTPAAKWPSRRMGAIPICDSRYQSGQI